MYTVYKITNLINNKCYIGSSIRVEQRWKQHKNSAFNPNSNSYNYPLQKAIRKYGLENFQFEIISQDYTSMEEMQKEENKYIIQYNSVNNGYNQTYQTNQYSILKEGADKYREKISQKCAKVDKDEKILETYNSYQEASRKNGSNIASNIRKVCKGISSCYNGMYFRDLDENDKVVSIPIKSYKNRKPVIAISINDPSIELYFESILKASQEMNIERSSIEKCIAGQTRYSKVGGYIWRTLDENGIVENQLNIDNLIEEYNETNPMINGERHTITEWCDIFNISRNAFYYRKRQGKTTIEALTEKKRR